MLVLCLQNQNNTEIVETVTSDQPETRETAEKTPTVSLHREMCYAVRLRSDYRYTVNVVTFIKDAQHNAFDHLCPMFHTWNTELRQIRSNVSAHVNQNKISTASLCDSASMACHVV